MPGVTNVELARQIAELRQLIVASNREASPAWDGWRHDVEVKLTEIGVELANLTKLVESNVKARAETCPYQVAIARAEENHTCVKDLQRAVAELRVDMARYAALGGGGAGGIVAIIAGVVMAIGRAKGWW